jgi:hypothetical protein
MFGQKLRDCRTLATKDERHRLVTKCRLPRFETSDASSRGEDRDGRSGVATHIAG